MATERTFVFTVKIRTQYSYWRVISCHYWPLPAVEDTVVDAASLRLQYLLCLE